MPAPIIVSLCVLAIAIVGYAYFYIEDRRKEKHNNDMR